MLQQCFLLKDLCYLTYINYRPLINIIKHNIAYDKDHRSSSSIELQFRGDVWFFSGLYRPFFAVIGRNSSLHSTQNVNDLNLVDVTGCLISRQFTRIFLISYPGSL